MRVDLADFFLSVSAAHVRAIFAKLGYPSETSWLLACLATNVAPVIPHAIAAGATWREIQAVRHAEMLARTRHLPQGAPTSPALASLAAYALDVRLSAAAAAVGARYSRYADETIVHDEGFVVNREKTRLMRRGARQVVTGIVVNEKPTIARADVERLEAILFNCVRSGPAGQNRDGHPEFRAHLRGRIAYVKSIARSRAERLEELFAQIVWD